MVTLQRPSPAAIADPTILPSANSVTEAPASASPPTSGVVSAVRPSVDDDPVSEPAAIRGASRAEGAAVSTVMVSGAEATP